GDAVVAVEPPVELAIHHDGSPVVGVVAVDPGHVEGPRSLRRRDRDGLSDPRPESPGVRLRNEDLAALPCRERHRARLAAAASGTTERAPPPRRRGRPPMRAPTRKSPEPSVNGRPLGSTTSRARNGSTAATPSKPARKGTISDGRSPTIPERPPASALTQRSERSVASTQTRTVSRIEATVTIIASVIPRAIASAVTAIPLRASPPSKTPAASRPSTPNARESRGPAPGAPRRRRSGAASARAAPTTPTAANPKTGTPWIGSRRERTTASRSAPA